MNEELIKSDEELRAQIQLREKRIEEAIKAQQEGYAKIERLKKRNQKLIKVVQKMQICSLPRRES